MNIKDLERVNAANEQHVKEFKKDLIKGIWINVKEGKAAKVEIHDKLDDFYKYCDCDLIDIVYRKIGGIAVNIVIDDEGLLKSDYICSAVDSMGRAALVGNLLVFSGEVDDEGGLLSLTDAEIKTIMQKNIFARCVDDKIIPLLGPVEY